MQRNENHKLTDRILQKHPFGPVWNEKSKILILGSFPSVKSRQEGFYYAHPQNRFWKLLAELFKENIPSDIPSRKAFLLKQNIALFDVINTCEIKGSSDASIKFLQAQDLSPIFKKSQVHAVFCNGKKAGRMYKKYQLPVTGVPATVLPSTSSANASWSFERLKDAWSIILR